MEGRKKSGSSSSFTTELFGSRDSPVSTSSGIFGSIFAPPSKVVGRESLRPEVVERRLDSASQAWNAKNEKSGIASEGEHMNDPNKDRSSFYQEDKMQQPCHLSSSIYYGGPDVYAQPHYTHSTVYKTYNKDGEEDDSNSASRGNWWQGSRKLFAGVLQNHLLFL